MVYIIFVNKKKWVPSDHSSWNILKIVSRNGLSIVISTGANMYCPILQKPKVILIINQSANIGNQYQVIHNFSVLHNAFHTRSTVWWGFEIPENRGSINTFFSVSYLSFNHEWRTQRKSWVLQCIIIKHMSTLYYMLRNYFRSDVRCAIWSVVLDWLR